MVAAIPVVVVGGGPSGLAAALFLAERGIEVTVLERHAEFPPDPRAATFHPPTLEIFEPSGVTAELHRRGIVGRHWQFRDRQTGIVCEFDLGLLGDETPFPYRLQCEQHKLVEILRDKLQGQPTAKICSGIEVTAVEARENGVAVRTSEGIVPCCYVIGADGGRSVVRKSAGISFEGFTYEEQFLVITTDFDFSSHGYAVSNYVSDPREWAALFQVPGNGSGPLWRVVFPTRAGEEDGDLLDVRAATERLARLLPETRGHRIVHTNLYSVHQRVAGTFRKGRVLLIGDAAHVNNPLGGMGMNFGIHDAACLAERLADVLEGRQDDTVLDQFDRQRRFAATEFLQAMTIQNKKVLEETDEAARLARQADLRAIANDPARSKAHLMRTSMIEGLRTASAIA